MLKNILKKLLLMIPILITVSIILFFLMNILPGDAAAGMATADQGEEYIAELRARLNLDKPPVQRYLDWASGMLRGDFGNSLISGQPVAQKIMQRLPVTLELTFLAMLVAVIIALPLGVITAVKRNSALDTSMSAFAMVGVAMPPFWLGMLLVMLFSIYLGILPASGFVPFFENPLQNLRRMIMPAVTIGISFAATVMRQTRSAMLEVLDQDYMMTAEAKGLSDAVVIWKHGLRNALIPIVTTIAMQTGRMIGGAVVSESIFALPGMGSEIVDAILSRDTPVVMGMIMVVAFLVVIINTFMDIVYILIDPRIARGGKG